MNGKQANTLAMYEKVRTLFNAHTAVWSAKAPIAATFDKLEKAADTIPELEKDQITSESTGYSAQKKVMRKQLNRLVADVADSLVAYAMFTDNTRLQGDVEYLKRQLNRKRQGTVPQLVKALADQAEANRTAALAAGIVIDAQAITNLEHVAETLGDMPGDNSLESALGTNATQQLISLFAAADRTLLLLDKLVRSQLADAEFKALYKIARRKDDR